MLSDVVGTSVLTFAGVAAQLGWIPMIVFIFVFCGLAMYTSVLLSKVQQMFPGANSLGEAVRLMFGDWYGRLAFILVYGLFAFFGNASYLLVLGEALQGMAYDFSSSEWCLTTATFISCIPLIPFIVTIRYYGNIVVICFINLFLILAVLIIICGDLIHQGRAENVNAPYFGQTLTFGSFFGAMTNVLYSYAGHWMYLELMSEMSVPSDFPKVFYINAPVQLTLYLGVALIGYYYQGDKASGYLPDNIPPGTVHGVASALLFVHVMVAYLLKSIPLARYLHTLIDPASADETSYAAHSKFAACGIGILIAGTLVANAIPFFDTFLGLIGGILSGPIAYVVPIGLFVCGTAMKESDASRRRSNTELEEMSFCESDVTGAELTSSVSDELTPRPTQVESETVSLRNEDGASCLERFDFSAAFKEIGNMELLFMSGITVFIVLIMVVGTYSQLTHLAQMTPPFSCRALQVRNVTV